MWMTTFRRVNCSGSPARSARLSTLSAGEIGQNDGVDGGHRTEQLHAECARLVAENATLTAENARLSAENVELRSLVERLEARIAELEHRQGRNSGNSSLPPSRDDAEA